MITFTDMTGGITYHELIEVMECDICHSSNEYIFDVYQRVVSCIDCDTEMKTDFNVAISIDWGEE